ncbi:hypothetical protein SAMN04488513_11344 [Pseudozobellia thermophila]|uniref:Uncharacterized protein n=1 Tax=Pseudozobellia thermophila TaxID=192903 RepID=A0A1M6NFV8_9FLAO|nr:hypothetical protein SAMN04488513_11344 [Pseudozobellia thermophila]
METEEGRNVIREGNSFLKSIFKAARSGGLFIAPYLNGNKEAIAHTIC